MKTDTTILKLIVDHAGECPEGSLLTELAPGLLLLYIAPDQMIRGSVEQHRFYFDNKFQPPDYQIASVRKIESISFLNVSSTEAYLATGPFSSGWRLSFSGPGEFPSQASESPVSWHVLRHQLCPMV